MQGFGRPGNGAAEAPTRHLYVANCHGVPIGSLRSVFSRFGSVVDVCEADFTGTRVVVSFGSCEEAAAARNAWNRRCCEDLDGLVMVIEFAVPREKPKLVEQPHVFSSADDLQIPGLYLVTDFISQEEEQRLLEEVDTRPWQVLAKRRVQHHGYEFLYKLRNVDTTKSLGKLPDFVQPLLDKFSSLAELHSDSELTFPFDQLTVNEYPRGVGLSPHIDTHSAFQGSIISLTLAGSCVMEFRRYRSSVEVLNHSPERKVLFLPRRSLLVLSQESRYAWHHYIPHHKVDFVDGQPIQRASRRVSYTFRKVRQGPCHCTFREYCDSQGGEQPSTDVAAEEQDSAASPEGEASKVVTLATPEIEKTYVHKVYDAIAPHFSSTRFAKWPKVAEFLHLLPPGSLVVDAGCGNGKYLGLNEDCFFVGCDISPSLISICSRRGHEVFVGDAINLPFRNSCFDAAISIAVLHHLSTESRRRRAILELLRVVAKGGKVLVTVWAAEQEDRDLVKKWTPLDDKCVEGWVGNMSASPALSSSSSTLQKIDEAEEDLNEAYEQSEQQEYFVPWHLPYHRAAGTQDAVASGFARRDEKKSAIVYNRYYHVFVKGELERLVSTIEGAVIADLFFDKSNWCVVLQKL